MEEKVREKEEAILEAAEVLADLNANDIENQAPINHINDYMRDYMMDKKKPFDTKLLNGSFKSHAEAYNMLALQSTKKYKANVIRQFPKMRSAKRTQVVCVTDRNAASLAQCVCSYMKKDDEPLNWASQGIW